MTSSPRRLLSLLLGLSLLTLGACTSTDKANLVDTPPPVPTVQEKPAAPEAPAKPAAPEAPAEPAEVSSSDFDPATAALDAQLPVDSNVRKGKLDNGLTYFIKVNKKPEARAELRIALDAGSVLEDDDQLGMAHFVEHMAFNGTENFEKHELVDYLQSIGMRFGADINASTGFDQTIYKLTVPTDDAETLNKAVLVLSDQAGRVSFDPEEVDKERGVVLEEWRRSRGAGMRIANKQLPVMFAGSKYAERLPIGTEQSIQTTPVENLVRYFKDWYRPDLMGVAAVGDFDPDVMEGLIRKHFGSLEGPENPRPREEIDVPRVAETRYSIESDPELTNTTMSVMFNQDAPSEGHVGDYRRSIVEDLHTSMFNARLQELSRDPDSPYVGAGAGTGAIVRPVTAYQVSALVREGQSEATLSTLLGELERVKRFGFTDGELKRAKVQMMRQFEQVFKERDKQPSAAFASEMVRSFLNGESIPGIETELALVQRFLPGVTLEEVNALTDGWVTDDNRVIVIAGPEKEGVVLPSEQKIASIFDEVGRQELTPWVDRTKDQPLIAEMPKPGKVVKQVNHDGIDALEWHLENGIRVFLKSTDFKNDEILMSGYSPGGSSQVSDADHASGRVASTYMGQSGLGEFDLVELQKALAGKVASVSTGWDSISESVRGSASPQDLETLFQLTYLNFVAPRADEAIFQNLITQFTTLIENRSKSPESVFRDTFTMKAAQDHPRARPFSLELLEEMNADAALKVYKERFADASDFTFVFVGNFKPETMKPLVEQYLGSLPSLGKGEPWKDEGIEAPEGVVRFQVEKGLEPKSAVRLMFHGEAEWTRENRFDLTTLSRVLEIALIELVREEMGATYSVGVFGSNSRWPKEDFVLNVSYTCKPSEVDPILDSIFAAMKEIQENGPEQEMVDKVRINLQRDREVQLKQNRFWLSIIDTYSEHGIDFEYIHRYDELLDRLSVETVQEAARRYLTMDQYLLGVLKPEPGVKEESSPADAAGAP